MARISYIEEKDHPELAAEIAKIKGARGGLINIYKLLLHSPTVAMTWFEHIGAIRWKTKLTPRLREIAIVRIAQAARTTPTRCSSTCRASPCPMASAWKNARR